MQANAPSRTAAAASPFVVCAAVGATLLMLAAGAEVRGRGAAVAELDLEAVEDALDAAEEEDAEEDFEQDMKVAMLLFAGKNRRGH